MTADTLNKWLTLAANFGVLIGILLLLVELNQNSRLMEAELWNSRASQGIDLFMAMAESPELSGIEATLIDSGFPENMDEYSALTPAQKRQYYWVIRAMRFRLESLLAQQTLGLMPGDEGAISAGRRLLPIVHAVDNVSSYGVSRFEQLLDDVEKMRR